MSSLHHALARALGTPFGGRASAVEDWMRASRLGVSSLETSLRGGDRAVSGGRMMIERVPSAAVPGFFDAMGVTFGGRARQLTEEAAQLALPTITGWDASTGAIKLYVNASDASRDVRARLASALGTEDAPHVVGLNVLGDRVEEKTYLQSADRPAAIDERLAARFGAFVARDVVGGWVVSRTRSEGGERPRAVFAALKAGHPGAREAARTLPGWSEARIDELTPFALGPLKSIGFDLARPDGWTLYFKPPDAALESWATEPVLVVRSPSAELGLFLEPASLGRPSWTFAKGHALSYRVREGAIERSSLEALRGWAHAQLEAGVDPSALARRALPPEPWHVVDVP